MPGSKLCHSKVQKMKRIPLLLAASSIAVIALIAFQLEWIQHSRELSEELFGEKVCMALCTTVEQQENDVCCEPMRDFLNINPAPQATCEALSKDTNFRQTLDGILDFYQIGLNYDLSFTQESMEDKQGEKGTYSCSVPTTLDSDEDVYVNVSFPDKEVYVMEKMQFMLGASVLIILFITAVFLWAIYSLWKQKRQAEINTDFFNNMAHEFRTPLTNIGLASKMLSKNGEGSKSKELLRIIQRENSKLTRQVERVLHLAKVENGEYHLNKENLNLKEIFEGVEEELDIQIQEKQAKVNFDSVANHLEIFGDKVHLGNVFKNLLDNALKYSNDNPVINISAQQNGKGVKIQFEDNGIGIPKSEQISIFEKYRRIGKGNVQNCRGFGLGLSYVKMMIELHKGSVKVNSNGTCGSNFEIVLPSIQNLQTK